MKIGFVKIPKGKFLMGSPEDERDRGSDELQHEVEIFHPFYMLNVPVTQNHWEKVIGENPSRFEGEYNPVDQVSWYDAVRFCNILSERNGLAKSYKFEIEEGPYCYLTKWQGFSSSIKGLPIVKNQWQEFIEQHTTKITDLDDGRYPECIGTFSIIEFCQFVLKENNLPVESILKIIDGQLKPVVKWNGVDCEGFRLPTEAEWEYACNAGTNGFDSNDDLRKVAHFFRITSAQRYWNTKRVGQKKRNAFGLYDMLGNVSEWCYDYYNDYSERVFKKDGLEWFKNFKVHKGGSWGTSYSRCRPAAIGKSLPWIRFSTIGFRPVRTILSSC